MEGSHRPPLFGMSSSTPVAAPLPLRLAVPPGLTAIAHAAMATEFVLHLGGHEPGYLRQAALEAGREIDRLETLLSFYRESSDVTRLNRAAAGAEVSVSPETLACLVLAAEIARLTGGAFDAFTGRAAIAAKEQATPAHLMNSPDPGETDAPGPVVSLHPEAGLVRKLRAGPWLDLGAIGKGYALDVAAALLAEWDITTGFVSAGGSSLRGLGGPGWRLEVGAAVAPVALAGDFCLGASGFHFQASHIIDTRPSPLPVSTVRTVALAPSAALADAISTAMILLAPAQITDLVRQQTGVAGLVIAANGRFQAYGAPFA
jgi:thiamine biosynthesis lipoprotein